MNNEAKKIKRDMELDWNGNELTYEEVSKAKETNSVNDILAQRGSVYGSFEAQVECVAYIVNAMVRCGENNNVDVKPQLIAEWHYLAIKLARIASNPSYTDSYLDLSGYAELMRKEREK